MPHLRFTLGLALACLVAAGGQPAAVQSPSSLAFIDVNVVPMTGERVLRAQTVIVKGDRIAQLGPRDGVTVPADAVRVEGQGRFLMPGLGEMHGHLVPDGAVSERILALNALHGITTIRGMLGHPSHLTLRDRVAKGELLGPTIYTSGPSFSGGTAKDADTAVRMVKDQKAAGYDFLKIHPGVTRGVFDALARAAIEADITAQGHVPAEVGLRRALEPPYRAIDHLDGFVELLAGWSPGPDAPDPGFFGFKITGRVDESKIPALAADVRKAGVWIVPTEVIAHTFVSPEPPEKTLEQPAMRYVPAAMRDGWLKQKRSFNESHGIGTAEERERYHALRRRLIKALHAAGVKILVGADSPQVMSVPGVATHQELAHLVDAGLTPYQAIEAGTRNVAELFGAGKERGTIEAGKRADLILVEANPLERVQHASRIAGVVVGGRWLAKDEIASRLKALEIP